MRIDGSCHCGAIAYEADVDPDHVGICHCTDCQQLTGSPYRVTVSVPRENFNITAGKPQTYIKYGDNGHTRLQMFCGECGAPLFTTGVEEEAETIGIRWGGIRQRRDLRPVRQIWRASAVDWFGECEALPGTQRD